MTILERLDADYSSVGQGFFPPVVAGLRAWHDFDVDPRYTQRDWSARGSSAAIVPETGGYNFPGAHGAQRLIMLEPVRTAELANFTIFQAFALPDGNGLEGSVPFGADQVFTPTRSDFSVDCRVFTNLPRDVVGYAAYYDGNPASNAELQSASVLVNTFVAGDNVLVTASHTTSTRQTTIRVQRSGYDASTTSAAAVNTTRDLRLNRAVKLRVRPASANLVTPAIYHFLAIYDRDLTADEKTVMQAFIKAYLTRRGVTGL